MSTLISLPHNQPTRLRNVRCAYCNAEFVGNEPEKEHVIGKNFVPKGSHQQWWNLHLNACHACNQIKSRLENDISAITMQQPFAAEGDFDEGLALEAQRKGVATSQRTKNPVKDSAEEFQIRRQFGQGASITFGFTSPAQVDQNRLFQLARFQLAGFFYLMTYSEEAGLGRYWEGVYAPMDSVPRRDWGNAHITSFSKETAKWVVKFGGAPTSNGYFQALIKQNGQQPLWCWAIEWNKQYRLYGFFGDEALIREVGETLAKNTMSPAVKDGDTTYRYRIEVPLQEGEDHFFAVNTGL